MRKPLIWTLLFSIVFLGNSALAAPSVKSLTGSISNGSLVTIYGESFGKKPTPAPLVWETFEDGKFSNDWSEVEAGLSVTSTLSRSGNNCTQGNITYNNCTLIKQKSLNDGDKLYIQLWRRYTQDVNTNQKFLRIWPDPMGGQVNNLVSSWISGGIAIVEYCMETSRWFEGSVVKPLGNIWYNEEFLIQMSSKPSIADGIFEYIQTSEKGEVKKRRYTDMITRGAAPYDKTLSTIVIDNYGQQNGDVYMDDIYIDNTWARVMIGDVPQFNSCTHKEILIPTSWSSSAIDVQMNVGTFKVGESAYLFVVDEHNVPSDGYPITVSGAVVAIQPPANFGLARTQSQQ